MKILRNDQSCFYFSNDSITTVQLIMSWRCIHAVRPTSVFFVWAGNGLVATQPLFAHCMWMCRALPRTYRTPGQVGRYNHTLARVRAVSYIRMETTIPSHSHANAHPHLHMHLHHVEARVGAGVLQLPACQDSDAAHQTPNPNM